jgi:protein ImuB
MLYLCLSLPQLPLEARQPDSDDPVAIIDRRGSKRRLIACSAACSKAGIGPGMDATTATALYPEIRLIERSKTDEREALRHLAAWAEQFGSWVCFDAERLLLWIEIKSGLRYFGGVGVISSRVEHGLSQLGYSCAIGIAPTLEAAALLSRIEDAPIIEHWNQLAPELECLPLGALDLHEETAEALAGMGLRTIGNVLALPRDSVARRFDTELIDYLDRLMGRQPDPRKPYKAPRSYRRRFELLGSVENTEGLLFPLKRMLGELQGYLIARDTAVQEVHIELAHDGADPTRLDLRTTRPMRDAVRLFALVRERLERTALQHPVEDLVLSADQFLPLGDTQLELLDGGKRRDEGWEDLLDKLRARLGDGAVRQLGLQDDHRPEHAWCVVNSKAEEPAEPFPDRPLWLVEPRPVHALPKTIGKPERIEAGWWDEQDQRRDYYTAEAPDGSRLWLFRDADKDAWYLHGLWA